MSKRFLAVGEYLINPELLTYAISEGPQLRLGFVSAAPDLRGELRLSGEAAKEVLRWLRLNADFLTKTGSFGSIGIPAQPPGEGESCGVPRRPHAPRGTGWGPLAASEPESEGSARFLSRSGERA